MNEFVMKSRWIAIAFAVVTLFGAYVFISGENDGSAPEAAAPADPGTAQVAQGNADASPPVANDAVTDQPEFVDDEDLVDDAAGDDAAPDESGDNPDGGGDGGDFADSADSQPGDTPPG